MLSFEDVLKEFEEFLHAATYLEVLPCRWGYVRGFSTRVILSISMPSYVVLRKSCMTRWKMISRLKKRCRIRKEIDFG